MILSPAAPNMSIPHNRVPVNQSRMAPKCKYKRTCGVETLCRRPTNSPKPKSEGENSPHRTNSDQSTQPSRNHSSQQPKKESQDEVSLIPAAHQTNPTLGGQSNPIFGGVAAHKQHKEPRTSKINPRDNQAEHKEQHKKSPRISQWHTKYLPNQPISKPRHLTPVAQSNKHEHALQRQNGPERSRT